MSTYTGGDNRIAWSGNDTLTITTTSTADSTDSVGGWINTNVPNASVRSEESIRLPSGTTIKGIGAKLLFSYVKSKLSEVETKKAKQRISKLRLLVEDAKTMGQEALYQELCKHLVILLREQEVDVCGYSRYCEVSHAKKFIYQVKDKSVKFDKLEEYTRPLPKKVSEKVKDVKEKGIFDELWILYVDPNKENIKTTKEKVVEKDPILFGKFAYSDRLYFIIDWIDEYCDLTIDKFVEELDKSVTSQTYDLREIGEMSKKDIQRLKDEVIDRHDTLENTKMSNWEKKALEAKEAEKREKKGFFSKMAFWRKN